MSQMLRFDCPSAFLSLSTLLRRAQKMLWCGLALAVGMHIAFLRVDVFRQEVKTARPLTTKFIKRAPRLSKPLELKKRPHPKQRQIKRQMVSVKARVDRRQTTSSLASIQVVQALTKPRADVSRATSFTQTTVEPKALAEAILGSKQPKNAVDMSLEMVDIDALDTGRYQAMVIQDPTDKKNIKGFFHLATVYSVSMRDRSYHSDDSRTARALRALVQAMNRYTQIKSDMRGTHTFDSRGFYETPWVYSSARFAFKITHSEARNLGQYLLGGGFFVTDFIPHGAQNASGHWVQIDVSNRRMFKDALAAQHLLHGRDWDFQKLPNSHPLYHCFFDFPQGPPVCGDFLFIRGGWSAFDYLEGIIIHDRLLGLVCRKFFTNPWGDWGGRHGYGEFKSWDRQLQFGVNMIVFALSQEGSITSRIMSSVK